MIPTQRLLYKIDLKLNKVASGNHQDIPLPDKILILNEAQIRLLKKKVNINNLYQSGFDSFRSRYQDLQNLVVPYETVVPTKTTEVYPSYSTKVKDNFYLPVDIIAIASKDSCKERIINVPRLVKHSDLSTLMNNSHFNPSFDFQETLAVMSSDNIIVYSGDFAIDELKISYLRYPQKIDFEGYNNFDGTPSTTVDCELPDQLEDELVALAVTELAFIIGNSDLAQSQQFMSKNSE